MIMGGEVSSPTLWSTLRMSIVPVVVGEVTWNELEGPKVNLGLERYGGLSRVVFEVDLGDSGKCMSAILPGLNLGRCGEVLGCAEKLQPIKCRL